MAFKLLTIGKFDPSSYTSSGKRSDYPSIVKLSYGVRVVDWQQQPVMNPDALPKNIHRFVVVDFTTVYIRPLSFVSNVKTP